MKWRSFLTTKSSIPANGFGGFFIFRTLQSGSDTDVPREFRPRAFFFARNLNAKKALMVRSIRIKETHE